MATLGEFLLDRAWVTEAQLELALERQRQLGGRLGTCLLELDLITEDLLLQALSEKQSVPPARAADLREIVPDVVSLLSSDVAVKARAVPFRAGGQRVHVAMLDTGDLALNDEISFVIGKRVQFHVAIELRIAEALSRHYGTALPPRLTGLVNRLSGGAQPKREAQPRPRATAPMPASDADDEKRHDRPNSGHRVVPRQSRVIMESIPLTDEERAALEGIRTPPELADDADPEIVFTGKLEEAESSSDVGGALLEVLACEFVRVLLFRVSGSRHEVKGWLAQGPDLDLEWFRSYSIGLQHASIFRRLDSAREPFRGRLEKIPSHVALARCWGGSLGHECLMLPVFVRDHLVCVVYGDRASLGVTGIDMAHARRLVGKAAIAFERCILKHKLHTS